MSNLAEIVKLGKRYCFKMNMWRKLKELEWFIKFTQLTKKAGSEAILKSLLQIEGEFIRVENRHQSLEEIFMEKVGK